MTNLVTSQATNFTLSWPNALASSTSAFCPACSWKFWKFSLVENFPTLWCQRSLSCDYCDTAMETCWLTSERQTSAPASRSSSANALKRLTSRNTNTEKNFSAKSGTHKYRRTCQDHQIYIYEKIFLNSQKKVLKIIQTPAKTSSRACNDEVPPSNLLTVTHPCQDCQRVKGGKEPALKVREKPSIESWQRLCSAAWDYPAGWSGFKN